MITGGSSVDFDTKQ
jgi:hypothetical protein